MRIDELTRRDWSVGAPAPCGLADGFHAASWIDFDLAALTPAWVALGSSASTPNPFFESWFLIPALRHFDPAGAVHLALLVNEGKLVGLMPSWHDSEYHGRRLSHLASWLHSNAFCGAPLIAPGHEQGYWSDLLGWADTNAGGALFLHLSQMPEDSLAGAALRAVCADGNRSCRAVHCETRAMLCRGPSPESHLAAAVSAKKRKELRRQRKRLEDEGALAVIRQRDDEGLEEWADRFLTLELGGWKGAHGSALASEPGTAAFFRHALAGAAEAGRLERLELALDGASVAMLVTFLAGPGAFAFKTAFDEAFARFSPGMQLQIENLALLEDTAIEWCDSCAAADHPMIERIWRDRREIAWYSIAIGGRIRRTIGEMLSAIEARRAEKRV